MVEIRKSKREESLLKKRREGLQQGPLFGSTANNIISTVEKKVSVSFLLDFSLYVYIQMQGLNKGGYVWYSFRPPIPLFTYVLADISPHI